MIRLPAALAVLSATLVGCSAAPPDNPPRPTAPSAPATVTTVPVLSRKLQTTINLPAQLTAYESVDIYPKVTGFVQTVTVDRGSLVRHGQLLVRLTAPELISQRSQAEAAVRAAQSQLAAAQARLASDNGTYLHMVEAAKTPGVLAENDVTVAGQIAAADKSAVAAAEGNVAAAQDAVRTIHQSEAYLDITAPFDGIVTARNLHPGALIGPASGQSSAQPILQIVNNKRLRLIVPVPEAQAGAMKNGQKVSFTVPAFPGQTFEAPIARISQQVDRGTRTMPVELDVQNRNGSLSPGSFATAIWPVQRDYPTLFVPSSSVTTDQQHTFVIRVVNNSAQWVTVETGQTVAAEIEVFGDLKAGDRVIRTASDAIHAGDRIRAESQ